MMGHLNSFSASGGENLNKNFPKIEMPGGLAGGGGGMLKLRFDWYIIFKLKSLNISVRTVDCSCFSCDAFALKLISTDSFFCLNAQHTMHCLHLNLLGQAGDHQWNCF